MDAKHFDKAMTLVALGSVLVAVILVTVSSFYFGTEREAAAVASTRSADK